MKIFKNNNNTFTIIFIVIIIPVRAYICDHNNNVIVVHELATQTSLVPGMKLKTLNAPPPKGLFANPKSIENNTPRSRERFERQCFAIYDRKYIRQCLIFFPLLPIPFRTLRLIPVSTGDKKNYAKCKTACV